MEVFSERYSSRSYKRTNMKLVGGMFFIEVVCLARSSREGR